MDVVHVELIQAQCLSPELHVLVHGLQVPVHAVQETGVHRLRDLGAEESSCHGGAVMAGTGPEDVGLHLGVHEGGIAVLQTEIGVVNGAEGVLPEGAVRGDQAGVEGAGGYRVGLAFAV